MIADPDRTTFDAHLEAVGHPRRRRLLFALLRADGPDARVAVTEIGPGTSEEFSLSMRHVHLPKLAEMGVVEFDDDGLTVRRGPTFERIEPLVRLLDDHRNRLPEGLV